jgi:peroxiredoxin Q/BCP
MRAGSPGCNLRAVAASNDHSQIQENSMSKIEVGKKAPAFTLQDEAGAKVKLADLAGQWVVLYFYPKDDTPGCTVEACEFTSGLAGFEKLDASVFGCSADSPESHRKFIAKHKLKVKLLSDPDHAVMEKYGAWGEKSNYGKTYMGIIRSTTLIDPEGKVAHHWATVKAAGHAEKVREKLAELAR